MAIARVRNIGDLPRYELQSPAQDLNIIPFRFTVASGSLSDVSGVPACLGIRFSGSNNLVLEWADNLGGKQFAVHAFAVCAGAPHIIAYVNKDTIGEVRLQGMNGYQDGEVAGYVAVSSGRPDKGSVGALPDYDDVSLTGSAVIGDTKEYASVSERRLSCVRSPMRSLVFAPIVFTVDATGAHVDRYGPLEYEVVASATVGRVVINTSWDIGDVDKWVIVGTTDEGNTIKILDSPSPGVFNLDVESAPGVAADLIDGEQVRVLFMGPSGQALDHPTRSIAEAALSPQNANERHPVFALVRDPVLIPITLQQSDTIAFYNPAVPQGTAALPQDSPNEQVWWMYNGKVPARDLTAEGGIMPWVCADHTFSIDAGAVVEDFTPLFAGEAYHIVDGSAITRVGAGMICGYTLLSSNGNR